VEIIKKLKYEFKDVEQHMAKRIATLELELARERAINESVIRYAEGLEKKLNDKTTSQTDKDTKEDDNEVRNPQH
jgi:molybdopterin converting factor small subunit